MYDELDERIHGWGHTPAYHYSDRCFHSYSHDAPETDDDEYEDEEELDEPFELTEIIPERGIDLRGDDEQEPFNSCEDNNE